MNRCTKPWMMAMIFIWLGGYAFAQVAGEWTFVEQYDLITDEPNSFIAVEETPQSGSFSFRGGVLKVRCYDENTFGVTLEHGYIAFGDAFTVTHRIGDGEPVEARWVHDSGDETSGPSLHLLASNDFGAGRPIAAFIQSLQDANRAVLRWHLEDNPQTYLFEFSGTEEALGRLECWRN